MNATTMLVVRIRVQFLVRETQPGHPCVGKRNEYPPVGGDALRLRSEGRYGLCLMADKTMQTLL